MVAFTLDRCLAKDLGYFMTVCTMTAMNSNCIVPIICRLNIVYYKGSIGFNVELVVFHVVTSFVRVHFLRVMCPFQMIILSQAVVFDWDDDIVTQCAGNATRSCKDKTDENAHFQPT